MRKILLLLLLPLGLSAEIKSGTGQWRPDGNVKKVYETPLGQVYKFQPNEGNGEIVGCPPLHPEKSDCSCPFCRGARARITSVLSLKLPPKMKITIKTRYVALDFRIRVFPALDERRTSSALTVHLLDSGRPILGTVHSELHGRKAIRDRWQDDFYYSGQVPLIISGDGQKNLRRDHRIIGYGLPEHARSFIHPAFEPLSVRVIYDFPGRNLTYFLNGRSFKYPSVISGKTFRPDLRYFGLVTYGTALGKRVQYQYFELSSPQVHICDDLFELPPAPGFEPYPYENYLLDRKTESEEAAFQKALHHRNPDLQYAYALRYLYGEGECDPEKGLKLLEKAAKEHHAFALYQLGVCRWRGYGFHPGKNEERFLLHSMRLGHPEPGALLCLKEMHDLGLPWFRQKRYKSLLENIPSSGHDEYFLHSGAEFLSPKRLLSGVGSLFFSRENPKLNYLDCRLGRKDPFAFLPKALSLGYTGQEQLLQDALFRKRYEAYPYLLMCRILKNRIPEEKDIPVRMILRMKDDPLFLFCLALIRMKPEERQKYLHQNGPDELKLRASKEWPEKTAEAEFLRALRRVAAVSRPRPLCMHLPDPDLDPTATDIFEQIKFAADRGYAPAQYLIGKFYFHNDLPEQKLARISDSDNRSIAEKYLTAAAKQGSAPAILLLCRTKLAAEFPDRPAVLGLLEGLCQLKSGEAFLLKAETLLRLDRRAEALAAAKLAIANGDHRGWQFLARHGETREQRDCWRQFIVADRAARKQDVHDFYWPEPYREYLKWEVKSASSNAPKRAPPMESLSKPRAEAVSETGSKASSKKLSRKKEKSRSKIKIRGE